SEGTTRAEAEHSEIRPMYFSLWTKESSPGPAASRVFTPVMTTSGSPSRVHEILRASSSNLSFGTFHLLLIEILENLVGDVQTGIEKREVLLFKNQMFSIEARYFLNPVLDL